MAQNNPQPPMFKRAPQPVHGNARLRLLEEKATNLNRKVELLESNFVTSNKKRNDTLRTFDSEILELKRDLESLKQKVDLIIRELQMTAGKDELNTVKRYLDLWDLTRFVSRDKIEELIEEAVERHFHAQKKRVTKKK